MAKTSWGVRKCGIWAQLNHYLNIHSTRARSLQTLLPHHPCRPWEVVITIPT